MAKDPAFLFYSGDFVSGTQFFTDEQTGKYIRLLIAQHQTGHLSEKHMLLICKTHDEDIFSKFVKDDDGLFYNERLEFEIVKRKKFCKSRADNRKKDKDKSKTHEEHVEIENENDNIRLLGTNNYSTFYAESKKQYPTANDELRMMVSKNLSDTYNGKKVHNIQSLVKTAMEAYR